MARSTNKQIADRVATLKAMILSGSSNSTAVRFASDEWRVSGGVTFTFGGAPKGSPKAEVVEEVIVEPAAEPAPVRGLW